MLSTVAAVLARWDARRARAALDTYLVLWKFSLPASTRKLAEAAAKVCLEREAELERMTVEDREKAIEEWAQKLASEVAGAHD